MTSNDSSNNSQQFKSQRICSRNGLPRKISWRKALLGLAFVFGSSGWLLQTGCHWLQDTKPKTERRTSSHREPGVHSRKKKVANTLDEPSLRNEPRVSSPTQQGGEESIHLAMGVPTDSTPDDDWLMTKPQYALSYNSKRHSANWVSWNLNASYFGKVPRFRGMFMPDPALPEGVYHVRHSDYTNSGYDRGHLVRSEERTRTEEDNKSTFFTTNIIPQTHDMNAGPWLRFEEFCQQLAQKKDKELFIVAGGIYKESPKTIGHGVAVPDACFKIVVVLERGQQSAKEVTTSTKVIAIKIPNEYGISSNGWHAYQTSVAEIERDTGYNFLSEVDSEVQKIIETKVDLFNQ